MKKIYFLFLLALLPMAAYADAVEIDGIYYNLTAGNNTAEVTSNPNKYSGVVSIPATITYGNVEYNVNAIGYNAFSECSGLTSVTIPNSIISIGNSAFSWSQDLTSIIIPSSVTSINYSAFDGCSSLTSLSVEPGNTKYDSRNNCNAIIETETNKLISGTKNTIIPNNVTSIGNRAFYGCRGLTSITIPNSVTVIGDRAFMYSGLTSITIPNNVTSIEEGAFGGCNSMTSMEVMSGNQKYDSRDNCNAIIEAATNTMVAGCSATTIPATVKEIGSYALWNLVNCTIHLPSTITKINDNAFGWGDHLTLEVEQTTPLSINENVFEGISNSTLRVPEGSKSAYAAATGWSLFSNILEGNEGSTFTAKTTEGWDMVFTILDETKKTCQVGYLDGSWDKTAVNKNTVNGAVTIPEVVEGYTVKKIGKYAFDDIDGIKTISIPETVTSIDDYAFFSCDQISSFELPASVTNIGNCALAIPSLKVAEGNPKYDSRDNCNAIIETATNIIVAGCRATTIPATASEIGSYAFYGLYDCSIFLPSTITKIGDYAFEGNSLNLQVESAEPLEINENVFMNVQNSTLRVPAGCKAAYAAATGWKNFETILEGNEGSTFTAKTAEGWDMVFTILDETKKTCQVGYLDGSWDKIAVDRETVSGSVTIPEKANNYTVVKIGKWALTGINGMTSVTIPNTVTSIDEFAFRYCGLTSFELPANVTYVGRYALSALSNVTSVKVAEGNPNYDSRDNCNAIIETATNILQFGYKISTIPASVKELGIDAFYNLYDYTLTIPSTITKIGDATFQLCGNLTLQVEHTTPLEIDERVFYRMSNSTLRVPAGCKAAYAAATGWSLFSNILEGNEGSAFTAKTTEGWDMTFAVLDETKKTCQVGYLDGSWDKPAVDRETVSGSVTIPETVNGYTVVKIGKSSFSGVSGMTSVTIPNTVTSIDDDAFISCSELTSLELSANVTTIGSGAFFGLSGATSILVAEKNAIYDSRDNSNAIIETATDKLLFGCKNTAIPATVKEIERRAFSRMFNCTILIPSTINKINDFAFEGSNVTIQVERTEPLEIHENAINLRNSTLRVPAGSKAAYEEATGWSKFDKIVEMEAPSVRTINVETAGTLSSKISDEEKFTITDLTITGQLNGIDLRFIREMAGSDYNGVPTDGKLQSLDLSGATIVAGGANLELADQCIYLDKEKTNPLYGFIAGTYSSVANTFGENLFAGCQQLKSIKTPTSLIEIGNKVFAGSGLTSIDLNSGLTTLDPYAFWDSKLSSITIPKTVIHIGDKNSVDNSFAYIDELTSITLEAGNTRYAMAADGKLLIDTQRKAVVTALGNAAIPEGITWIGQNAFCNRPELVNYTIPNWVTQIGGNSFSQCINLKSVVISNQMTTIANSAFTDCPNLTSVTIPSSVTKIMYNAFGNTGLTEISIPSSVISIEGQAFAHNQNLETVISYITNPLDISDDVFAKGWNLSNTTYPQTLKVPYGTKDLYKAKTGWNKIANIVEMAQAPTITITAKSSSRAYGEANPTFGYDISGGTVTGTPTITCEATATSYIGTYPIVITAGTISDPLTKYVNGTLTITKAPLKITAGSYKKKQGEANPAFSVTYDGFKNNETASVLTTQPTIYCAATESSPAGTYEIVVSGAFAENYEISYVAGTLTIEAIPTPEPEPTPEPTPEPESKTFVEDVDASASKEVPVTFTITTSSSSDTPTVALSDDEGASGKLEIPETVTHNGVEYKVTEIADGAFQNNTGLTDVTIPASIVSIGANAFAGCTSLKSITVNIIVPLNLSSAAARALVRAYTRSLGDDVFEGVDKNTCILYVPEESVDAYKAAPVWKEFKTILPIKSSTGIYGVEVSDGEVFDVYNLSGRKVKSKVTSLDGLPRGIYIINGKKVVK